jgi:hypothetical protein
MSEYDEHFKFVVKPALNELTRDAKTQRVMVYTRAPIVVGAYELSHYLRDAEAIRMLQAEVKIKLIEAIMAGEWSFENE